MNYFFDESGNWSGALFEHKKLVLGGLLIANKNTERALDREFKIFQSENNLDLLHAMDLSRKDREACYRIIANNLSDNDSIIIRTYSPEIAFSKNSKQSEEIYSDLAADLVNTISFGDKDLNIFYDMKFYYAYPLNVIAKMDKEKPRYYEKMMKNFILKDEAFFSTRKKIEDKLFRNLKKGSERQKQVIHKFLMNVKEREIKLNSFDKKAINKLEKEKNRTKKQIENYLWSELWLKIEGEEVAREKFRDAILKNNKSQCKELGIDALNPNLILYFANKQEENPGVQVIDFICNLVYKFGSTPPENSSEAIQTIYNKIIIEDM